MQPRFGMGPMEIIVIALMSGMLLAPFGIPPLPPDETILRAAPEECLLFVSSAGIAKPDAASDNHTDQLLSDEQVKTFLSEFGEQFTSAIKQYSDKDPKLKPMVASGRPIAEVLLSRPLAGYVERVEFTPGAPPSIVAGFIVDCGDRKDEISTALDSIERMALGENGPEDIKTVTVAGVKLSQSSPASGVEVHWGFKDNYFLATIGPKAAVDLLKRISGSAPRASWLLALEKQAGVKRVSTMQYLDVAKLLELTVPLIPDKNIAVALDAAGVSDLTSLGAVSGLGGKGMVSRSFANFKSAPSGIFSLLGGPVLTADDLKPIPGKAMAALAIRLDLQAVYRKVVDILAKADSYTLEQLKKSTDQFAQNFGLKFEEDVLAAFGDVWTFHGTSAGGPNPAAGTVGTVTVKNKETLRKVEQLVLQMVKLQASQLPFNISDTKIGDVTAYRVVAQSGGMSPAWAISGDRLVVAGSLEALKSQISHETDSPRLAELQSVANRLKSGAVMVSYQDTKSMVSQVLALLQAFGPIGTGTLAQQGIKIEMPTIPDFDHFASHVLARTSSLRISKQTIISEAFDTVPLVGNTLSAAPAAGAMVALLLPAIQAARGGARGSIAMNNMKHIAMGLLNEESVYMHLPPAAISKDGKPLLSWRVKILPFIGERALFNEFHLDEPWDSEHNKPLAARMPAIFVDPRFGDLGGKTVFLAPTGPDTIFFDDKGASIKDITDGTSQTIMVVEVDPSRAVPWTKPEDLTIDKAAPATGLRDNDGRLTVLFADGAVIRLPGETDAPSLWGMFTRAGGEKVVRPTP